VLSVHGTTVVGDHPKTTFQEEHHLTVPIVRAQWPAVMEEERLTGAPILVEDFSAIRRGEYRHLFLLAVFRWTASCCCPLREHRIVKPDMAAPDSSRITASTCFGTQMPDGSKWTPLSCSNSHFGMMKGAVVYGISVFTECNVFRSWARLHSRATLKWGQFIWLKCGEMKHYF
jgi:hypothetical protein